MGHDDIAIFRLPRRWQVGLFAIVMLGPCANVLLDLRFGMDLSPGLINVAALALFWILVWTLLLPHYTVQLRPDGIKLYGLWWLPWTDVSAVRHYRVFGLPHFSVKRVRGFSWSIPLCFVGDRDLAQAIIDAAPPGNPFRLVSMPP